MSPREQFNRLFEKFFKPDDPRGIRRLHLFWAGCLGIGGFCLSYGIVLLLFSKDTHKAQEDSQKPTPTPIETASQRVGTEEAWRYKIEGENKKNTEEIAALKTLFQTTLLRDANDQENPSPSNHEELQDRILQLESQIEELRQTPPSSHELTQNFSPQSVENTEQDGKIIQKFTLGLSENPKSRELKTVETTIPAGAFAKTILLSGLDASASMSASSDPRPMLLRLIHPGTLPRRFQSDLKDCHCTASAYGDLSSERIYARLEKLTCIERDTGEIIETQVAGYIAGSDGKAGIRGIVASKDGKFLERSLIGGIFAGLSNVANPQNRQAQVNPFYPGSAQVSPPSIGQMFTSGMASGASSALDRLSQYYIDRAEQLQPVIQVAAGQVVDIVFTEGTFIGSQNIKSDIEKTREEARSQTAISRTQGCHTQEGE